MHTNSNAVHQRSNVYGNGVVRHSRMSSPDQYGFNPAVFVVVRSKSVLIRIEPRLSEELLCGHIFIPAKSIVVRDNP